MPFCKNCGTEYANGSKFCAGCGTKTEETNDLNQNMNESHTEKVLWEGKPSNITNKMKGALNTVTYTITNERVIIKWGLIGKKQEEIELVKIEDISVRQSVTERIQKIGQVIIISKDKTTPAINLENIQDPNSVKEIIRKASQEEKMRLGYKYGEVH